MHIAELQIIEKIVLAIWVCRFKCRHTPARLDCCESQNVENRQSMNCLCEKQDLLFPMELTHYAIMGYRPTILYSYDCLSMLFYFHYFDLNKVITDQSGSLIRQRK